jgi:hypothetical protein
MVSKVEIKTIEALEKMHTGTLMSRRVALLKCEESFVASDHGVYEAKPSASITGIIEYKDSREWKQAYKQLKDVLAAREHVPNKQERKKLRQLKAKKSK